MNARSQAQEVSYPRGGGGRSGALTQSGFEFPTSKFASQLLMAEDEGQQSLQTNSSRGNLQGRRFKNSLDT